MTKETGYFKIWRELFQKPIWTNSTSNQRSILIAILSLANWQENNWEWCGEQYKCSPGEFITSHDKLKNAAGKGITNNHVRTALKRFEMLGFLTIKSPKNKKGGIKLIVNNWNYYQNTETQIKHEQNTIKTISNHEQITTIEEYKNIRNKEYKNNIILDKKFKIPSLEEIKKYCEQRKNNVNPEQFHDYYSSNGWKVGKNPMKDWKAAVRTWEKNNKVSCFNGRDTDDYNPNL